MEDQVVKSAVDVTEIFQFIKIVTVNAKMEAEIPIISLVYI